MAVVDQTSSPHTLESSEMLAVTLSVENLQIWLFWRPELLEYDFVKKNEPVVMQPALQHLDDNDPPSSGRRPAIFSTRLCQMPIEYSMKPGEATEYSMKPGNLSDRIQDQRHGDVIHQVHHRNERLRFLP